MFTASPLLLVGGAGTVYATMNPADKGTGIVLSNGNLTVGGATVNNAVRATIGKSAGKWYWEAQGVSAFSGIIGVGNATASLATYCGGDINGWSYSAAAFKYNNNAGVAYGSAWTANTDVIGIALDMNAGTVTFYLNNLAMGTAFTGLTGTLYPMVSGNTGIAAGAITMHFGAATLAYTPPAGFNPGLYQ